MISIVIPVFNQHEATKACLQSIIANTEDCQIVLVDNGSKPAAIFPEHFQLGSNVYIRNEENKGFPVAINQGLAAATGDTVILLNDDCIVTQGWAKRLLAHLDSYSIVGPVTNYCAGLQQVSIPVYQDEQELNIQAEKWAVTHTGESQEVNWIIGFCMAFKKSLWEELGPFDESLWPCSGEELDFCLNARKTGYKVGIAKDVYVHHEGSQTFKDLVNAKQINYKEICDRNDAHIRDKHGESWDQQKVVPEVIEGIRLNLGCGEFPMKDFINIDQFEGVHPDLICDIIDLPYGLNSISEIYAGHVLEHFTFKDGKEVLRYWHSLLKPGGMINIVVPNFDFLVKEYIANPSPERLIILNDVYIYSTIQQSVHQYVYSADLLYKIMSDTGFKNITRMPVDHHYFPFAVDWQCGFQAIK